MIEANQFYFRDSFEFLPTLPDQSVNAIITDPPYDFKQEQKEYLHQQFLRISKGVIIVFAPPENQWILPANQYGFWVKPTSTKNTVLHYGRYVEMLFFYGRTTWNKRHWSQAANLFFDFVDDNFHPNRKPPSLIERLVLNHTDPGHLILDPFAGSMVLPEVATRNQRHFIAIELDGRYQIDAMRIKQIYKPIAHWQEIL